MSKIVFYIRALFHESIMPRALSQKVNIVKAVENFNRFSNISAQEYREEIHRIQISNLLKISDRFIINKAEGYENTFNVVQPEARRQLANLADDDIVIPLDDDDWLSPELKKIEFLPRGATYWNSFVLNYANNSEKSNLKVATPFELFKPTKEYPLTEVTEPQACLPGLVLSNCQAYSATIIKAILENAVYFNKFMQRHSFVRGILRTPDIIKHVVGEKIHTNYLAAYVRHAANLTCLDRLDLDDLKKAEEEYLSLTAPFKSSLEEKEIPSNFLWCLPYLRELEQLHSAL